MEKDKFFNEVYKLFNKGLRLMESKSADYADTADVFANFKQCEVLTGVSKELGVMVRLSDKMSRIVNLLERDAKVMDESIADTILDSINYLAILHNMLLEEGDKNDKQ